MPPQPLATIDCTDGTRRPVYVDALGQYILDDGEPMYGAEFYPLLLALIIASAP